MLRASFFFNSVCRGAYGVCMYIYICVCVCVYIYPNLLVSLHVYTHIYTFILIRSADVDMA